MISKKPPLAFETVRETYTSNVIEAEGGTSVVHRVIDSEGNRWALKCLKPDQATRSRTKRFLNELEFCLSASHLNVIRVIDHGFTFQGGKKCPFYVMPLFSSTLRKAIRAGVPTIKVMHYFSEILNGVEAAHLRNVWHRDLKPENILLDSANEHLVVSDFGIAHFTVEAMLTVVETRPGDRLANFQYAAPEQRTPGAVVDYRADIYALGLILNEMFTGQVPQGVGFRQIADVAPEFTYLDEIVDRMIQHSLETRPQSIDEIKRILIAKNNDFVSRQKLDSLRNAVVPSTTIEDPLVKDPPRVVGADIQGDVLSVRLSQAVSGDWIRIFRVPRAFTFIQGSEPINWVFQGDTASVRLDRDLIDRSTQQIIGFFKDYLQKANQAYRQYLEVSALQREKNDRRALQASIAEEERRQRLLGSLSF
jgi:serine/threonine protein kinase